MTKEVSHGENIRIYRTILGMKQETLGKLLGYGEKTAQSIVSDFEKRQTIDKDILEKIAKALEIPVELLENYTGNDIITIIRAFNDNAINQGAIIAYHPIFNYNGENLSNAAVKNISKEVLNGVLEQLKTQPGNKSGE